MSRHHPTLSGNHVRGYAVTHEQFIHAVAEAARLYASSKLTTEQQVALQSMKLVYGRGEANLRGVTCHGAWHGSGHEAGNGALVEICASCEESWIQLAGTTLHELGHVISGYGAGHDKEWKANCAILGLRRVHAAGTMYKLASFAQPIRMILAGLNKPADGTPKLFNGSAAGLALNPRLRPCGAGIGTRGGKSRGVGSGSRLRRFTCGCVPPVIVRASRDILNATCDDCSESFVRS